MRTFQCVFQGLSEDILLRNAGAQGAEYEQLELCEISCPVEPKATFTVSLRGLLLCMYLQCL